MYSKLKVRGQRAGNRFAKVTTVGAVLVAMTGVLPAAALTNLVTNGNFSSVTLTTGSGTISSAEFGTANNGFTPTEQITGWTTAGYNFVFLPGTADSTGATGQYSTLKLWGPNDGSANGFTTTASPTGGNFIGADSAYEVSAISTTVNGLTPGKVAAVSFSWAGAQQSGFTSPAGTTEQWSVSLNDVVHNTTVTQNTQVLQVADKGFSGWLTSTMYFIPTSASEVLSFLATGTPSGVPPFALLANVSVTTVPEPATAAIMVSGIVALLGLVRSRRGWTGASV